jgi:hypothetical protein
MSDEYNEYKREIKKDADGAIDDAHSTLGDEGVKIQEDGKAVANKGKDPDKDAGSEYQREKVQ